MSEQKNICAEEGELAGEAFYAYVNGFVKAAGETGLSKDWLYNKSVECFLVYYERILNDAYDKYGIPMDEQAAPDCCARCQCNTCAHLDTCEAYEPTDGITPPPCAVCEGGTHPLFPIEVSACEGYDPAE